MLTLTGAVRACAGLDATRIRAPLTAFDQLLGNRHLHTERVAIDRDMMRWIFRGPRWTIIIDWSDLKPDKRWSIPKREKNG